MDETRIDYARALAEAADHLRTFAELGRRDRDLAEACPDQFALIASACYPVAALNPAR
ncbi:hypothetical protein IHQ68_03945 [Chelatococcus sambhunathii]|uniref:Uncharacterized protein n=1 Tax=Chelatococcus sambhunathii TaxID=363953 RepID=A0ABU1DCD8_9HYPH|nr:hypothetical protein [Chelatococcus sambhunathii]MDR4305776.1 hypothetical protein [Chelatococcus sambhunathii]